MNLTPKRPQGAGWVRLPAPMYLPMRAGYEVWQHDSGICVISGARIAADGTGVGHTVNYELDLTFLGKSPCTAVQTEWALTQFALLEPASTKH